MAKVTHILEGTEKLRELALYISISSEGDDAFGSTKLNKLLFYSDFISYLQYGKSITEQEYQKLPNGPAPRIMKPLIDDMQNGNDLILVERHYYNSPQKKPIARRSANLSLFTGAEIALVDQQIRRFWCMNATEISNESHKFVGWALAKENETIPYESALLEHRDLTEQEISWAFELDMSEVEALLAA